MPARQLKISVMAVVRAALFSAVLAGPVCAASPDAIFADARSESPAWQPVEPAAVEANEPTAAAVAAPETQRAAVVPANETSEESLATAIPALKPEVDEASSAHQLDGLLSKLAWFTGTVGLVAVVSLWLLRTWLQRRDGRAQAMKSLTLVDSLRVGPRCGLYLVQADQQRVLVGVDSSRGMSLLALPANFADTLSEADADGAAVDEEPEAAEPSLRNRLAVVSETFGGLAGRRRFAMGGRT